MAEVDRHSRRSKACVKVLICDLSYAQQIVSAEVDPLLVGGIATNGL